MSLSIYIAMHKPYRAPEDPAYVPIQVGAAGKKGFLPCRDDLGENISEKNPAYCELTAVYWMWKHAQSDILGLAHYRRHFASRNARDPWQRILSGAEAESLLEEADVLVPKKRHYVIETNYSQYAHAHYEKDLLLTRKAIEDRCPAYLPAFDTVMKQRSGHRFNMFVMRKPLFDRYCGWLFPLLFHLEEQIDTTDYSPYDRRVMGFLAERLLDVFLLAENLTCREVKVVNLEGENWIKKGTAFCLRKLRGTFYKK